MQCGRLVAGHERRDHEKDLRLPFVEIPEDADERFDIALVPPNRDGWRMLSRRSQVGTIARAVNFCKPLRAATDCANLVTQGRAMAPGTSLVTEGTWHDACIVQLQGEAMVQRESAVAYFKELVDAALTRQNIGAGELTAYYVVQLLAGFLERPSGDDADEVPLAFQLARALERAGPEQRASLKQIGDVSLFVSGFFSDSLRRKLVDVDYYVCIGGSAYGALSRQTEDTFATVFAELAGNFVGFVDVLSEVSERSSCGSNTDLLRLYERWLRTGSPRSGQLLVERGVVPNASFRGSRIQ